MQENFRVTIETIARWRGGEGKKVCGRAMGGRRVCDCQKVATVVKKVFVGGKSCVVIVISLVSSTSVWLSHPPTL